MRRWDAYTSGQMVAGIGFLVLIESAIGAYFECQVTPYITIAYLLLIVILVCFDKLKKHQKLILYFVSASLLLGTSMIGKHIIGNDIHSELFIVNHVLNNGWDLSYSNGNNTSFALGFLSPYLTRWIDPVMQFKLMYPLLFALVPVFLYSTYSKLFTDRIAALSALFIAVMPMFVLDMTSHVKGMMSQTFMVLALCMIVRDDIKYSARIPLTILGIVLAILCHYSVAATIIILLGFACVAYILILVVKSKGIPFKKFIRTPLLQSGVIGLVMLIGWYSIAGNGSMLLTFERIGNYITIIDKPLELEQKYEIRTQPVEVTGTYLDKQEQVIRTAIGLDFGKVDTWGKVFRILQYLTEIAAVFGLFIVYKKRKELPVSYITLCVSAFIVLTLLIFYPYLATVMSTTRFYQITLYLIAPIIISGLVLMLRKPVILCCFLIAYTLFTTGFIFEVTRSTDLTKITIPYSLALSNYRLNINETYDSETIAAANWLTDKFYKSSATIGIRADYNGKQLLTETINQNVVSDEPSHSYYLFLTTYNIENMKFIRAKTPGLRYYNELEIPENSIPVYEDRIYYVIK
jgi:uncharacterized membrane protein